MLDTSTDSSFRISTKKFVRPYVRQNELAILVQKTTHAILGVA